MQGPEIRISEYEKLVSPVEERHIDYILEEEFSVNPEFLRFFLEQARLTATDPGRIAEFANQSACIAVRSVTTGKGETDLLVEYGIQNGSLPIALLIEDKIRAGFQPDQPERHRERGEAGIKDKSWSNYWTCLVCHSKYFVGKGEFDTVVTLQAIHGYFAQKTGLRSRFRAVILEQTIRKYETTGIQKIDPGMTRFRAMYAVECANYFQSGLWEYDKARDAWWDDNWFLFRLAYWPKGVKIVHQARSGRMKLVLPILDEALLHGLVEQRASLNPSPAALRIIVIPYGKTMSALEINVPPVTDFSDAAQPPLSEEFFAALEVLADFYRRCSHLLPEALHITFEPKHPPLDGDSRMTALRAMLLGFMRCTVTCLGTGMPYPLPELSRLSAVTPEAERYFASFGLMGGFHLEIRQDEKNNPYIISEQSSRQWGTYSVRHKISVSEVLRLDDEA